MKKCIIQILICVLGSCMPFCESRVVATFENCTDDTIFVGVSHYDNIDSIGCQLLAAYDLPMNKLLDTTGVSLWKDGYTFKDQYIYPDSACGIDANYSFDEHDTCYFFIIKWRDAKKYSWDEICDKKLYYKTINVRNMNGEFDGNIRY